MGYLSFISLPWEVLSAKYGGFQTPVIRVSVNNNLLSLILSMVGLSGVGGIRTDGVSVTLNKDAASSATFRMLDCYNSVTRTFNSPVSVGSKISIQLGYGSMLSTVFVGYVGEVSYEFGETPAIKVTAYDAVKLMMEGGDQERHWKHGGFYMQTINEVLKRYADSCTILPINMLPTVKTHGHLVQTSHDYSFLKETLCRHCARDFVVAGGTGYLFDFYSFGPKVTTMSWGKGLKSFSVSPSYAKVKVCVTGDRFQNIRAESVVKTGSAYKTSMDKEQTITQENEPLLTVSDCKELATRLATEEVRKAQQATGSCIGLPDLMPGRCIGISGMDPEWDGKKYLLSSVTHEFGTSGYTTSFTVQGWE